MSSQNSDSMWRYGTAPCALGAVAITTTENGIRRIELGADAQQLRDDFVARFPNAQLTSLNRNEQSALQQLVEFIERPSSALQLPLDIQGTVFQRQVWQALRDIPLGATASYSEIATRIGKPTAIRAVATACANNRLALAIPCHRVIRSNGELAGYRWGVERKQQLLQREAAQVNRHAR